jgi:putative ABC transport system permease protein
VNPAGQARPVASRLPPLEPSTARSPLATVRQSAGAALESLRAYRLRAALTVVGTALGVAALVLTITLAEVTRDLGALQWSHVGADAVMVMARVMPGGSKLDILTKSPLTVSDARVLARLPHVTAVSPTASLDRTRVVAGERDGTWAVLGAFPSIQVLRSLAVDRGIFYAELDEASAAPVAVIGPAVADRLFVGVDPVGQELRLGVVTFHVVGVIARATALGGPTPWEDTIWVPFSTCHQRLSAYNPPTIMLQVDRRENVEDVMAAVAQTLDREHRIACNQPSDFQITNQQALIDLRQQQAAAIGRVMTAGVLVALLLSGVGLTNLMLMALAERTPEIGLRLAVGARIEALRAT